MKKLCFEVTTVFQLSIYSLTCLAGLMLALAEGAYLSPQVFIVPIVLLAYFFNERWKVIVLPMLWANVLGLVAFAVATWEFFGQNLEARLLAGAHLLVYLTWIVLFQEKNARQYWWICALGLLQVAVGSVLTEEPWFGMTLLAYMVLAIWTLTVFSMCEAQNRYSAAERSTQAREWNAPALAPAVPGAPLPRDPNSAAGFAAMFPLRAASIARNAIQHDPHEQWINSRLVGGVLATTFLSTAIGVVFFTLIPRVWIGKRGLIPQAASDSLPQHTGFTEEVKLGDIGRILERDERMFEVQVVDNDTGAELDIYQYTALLGYDEPLFRGNVMARYIDGKWKPEVGKGEIREFRRDVGILPGYVRQEYRMQFLDTRILFAIPPAMWCDLENSDHNAEKHQNTWVLSRPQHLSTKDAIYYKIYSPQMQPGDPPPALFERRINPVYLQLPETGFERLKELAVQKSGLFAAESPTPLIMASRLAAFLRDSGEFTYSLNLSVDDKTIDPIEDFLFNRKRGHCEYYASALALMLRAVGIPSRLVSGFKGGDVNSFNGNFVVRQRHAHVWVEALIDRRWIVMDATPAERTETLISSANQAFAWRDFKEMLGGLWSQRVVRMDLPDQQSLIYEPASRLSQAIANWAAAKLAILAQPLMKLLAWLGAPRRWFSWQGGLIALVVLLLAYCLVSLILAAIGYARAWIRRRGAEKTRSGIHIDFYERFARLVAQRGFIRGTTQTQMEFAGSVERYCADVLPFNGLSNCPFDIAGLFYRVRFGDQELSAEETQQVGRMLTQLEECFAARNENPAHRRNGV